MTRPLLALLLIAGAAPAAEIPAKYREAVAALDGFAAREVAAKGLPALSVALVDDQVVVWSKGYGFVDRAKTRPATSATLYRVGSVSKLFTDVALMQLVEAGKVDLDAPARRLLPGFAPKGPGAESITLRQLMAHRSGLVREPPVGSYFDPDSPSVPATVASLNGTALVYPPTTRLKYSNAAIAAVGLALEGASGGPFASTIKARVLDPLGMGRSGFVPPPEFAPETAGATMWTYHGRGFPAPTFEFGIAPAASLYSTADDLARFLMCLFADGKGPDGRPILKPESLAEMLKIQSAGPDEARGFGLGFSLSRFDGRRRAGHGGAVYGFATELAALPDDKLGVVAIASKDCANPVVGRVADYGLRLMRAAREGQPLPTVEETAPLPAGVARHWAGSYRSADESFDLTAGADGRLFYLPGKGGNRVELRALGAELVGDDTLGFGPRLTPDGDKLRLGDRTFDRVADEPPAPPPAHFAALIGEYGWDHNTLYILERGGKLHALIEWFFLYPLTEESPDVFAFPDSGGLYHGEKVVFRRDPSGRATAAIAAGVTFNRRPLDGESGQTFRIKPVRPVAEIRHETLDARPPVEAASARKPDLVDLAAVVPGLILDIRYAKADNFLGEPVYTTARAFLQRPAAEALARVQAKLKPRGLGLMIHDAYRPWKVTKLFWEATPEAQHLFVANPARGSRHNRGCAVDLTLCDLANGRALAMVGGYDEFSERSFPDYPGGTARQRYYRDLLRAAMEAERFTVNEAEWWHFDHHLWRDYPIGDIPFEAIGR